MEDKRLPTHILAVAGIVRNEANQILLVRHHRHGWVFPGGIVEPGENLIDGLKREILEETGVVAAVGEMFCITSNTGVHPGYNGVKEVPTKLMLDFICAYRDGTPQPSDENSESGFFSLAEAAEMIRAPAYAARLRAFQTFSGRPSYLEYVTEPEFRLKLERTV